MTFQGEMLLRKDDQTNKRNTRCPCAVLGLDFFGCSWQAGLLGSGCTEELRCWRGNELQGISHLGYLIELFETWDCQAVAFEIPYFILSRKKRSLNVLQDLPKYELGPYFALFLYHLPF